MITISILCNFSDKKWYDLILEEGLSIKSIELRETPSLKVRLIFTAENSSQAMLLKLRFPPDVSMQVLP